MKRVERKKKRRKKRFPDNNLHSGGGSTVVPADAPPPRGMDGAGNPNHQNKIKAQGSRSSLKLRRLKFYLLESVWCIATLSAVSLHACSSSGFPADPTSFGFVRHASALSGAPASAFPALSCHLLGCFEDPPVPFVQVNIRTSAGDSQCTHMFYLPAR